MKVELSQSSFKRQHAHLIFRNDGDQVGLLYKHLDGFGSPLTWNVFEFRRLDGKPFTGRYTGLLADGESVHLLERGHQAVSVVDLGVLYDLDDATGLLVRYAAQHQGERLVSDWTLFRLWAS